MSYVVHDTVIITAHAYPWRMPETEIAAPDIDLFRAEMPEALRQLVLGPFQTVVNDYMIFIFLPDGGFPEESHLGRTVNEWRRRFIDMFSQSRHADGSSPFDISHLRVEPLCSSLTRFPA